MKRGNSIHNSIAFKPPNIYTKESLTFETINDLNKYMQTVAVLLDGFVSIIYANYYLHFNGNKQGYYSYLVLTAVECLSVLIFIYLFRINLQSST